MKTLKASIYFVALSFVLASCTKFRDNKEPLSAEENALGESTFFDAFRIAVNESAFYAGSVSNIDSCGTFTLQTTVGNYPVLITRDYGTNNCVQTYNFTRRGKIGVQLSGSLEVEGSRADVSFDKFYCNDYLVEGNLVIVNLGVTDSATNYSFTVTDGKITNPDNKIVSWNATYNLKRIEGELSNTFIWDDKYNLTGTANGTNNEGRNFETTIKEALSFELICRWPSNGVSEVAIDELKTSTINYGDGFNCDNAAKVEIGKRTYDATLR